MEEALQSLPWVDADTVKASAQTRRARFKVKDKSKFNLDEIKKVLAEKAPRFADVKLVAGPD